MQLAPYVTDYFPESFETVGEYVCHFRASCVSGITSSHIHCIITIRATVIVHKANCLTAFLHEIAIPISS